MGGNRRRAHYGMGGMTGIDVRAIRISLQMTQEMFAEKFGFNLSTLRQWEQGRARPDGAARTLLMVVSRSPEIIKNVVEDSRRAVKLS